MPVIYCSSCGGRLTTRVPPGDERPRLVCEACGTVHYQNPKTVVGCIPEKDGLILLCRRAIEPRYGLWTLPAGYLENGETPAEAAAREAFEETGSRVTIAALSSVITLIEHGQIYLIYRARLLDDAYGPTHESLEVRLFQEADIPWGEMAFASIREALRFFFADRARGSYSLHEGTIPVTERR